MAQVIKFKRGLKANLPASAAAGEPLFCTDTKELFVGTGSSVVPVVGMDENVKVGAAGTKDYLNENYFEQDETNHIRIKQNTLLTGVDADKVDGKNVDDTQTSTSYLWTAGKVKSYVDGLIQGLDWQNSVLDKDLATPPGSPTTGDRYIVAADATDAWAGKEGQIAEYNGSGWTFTVPNEGYATRVEDEDAQYVHNGTAWVKFGSTTTHNETNGLQGGTTNEYYHLTSAQASGLTGGSATTLHKHSTDNLDEGLTNLFFTNERAQDAVGSILTDGDQIDFTYDDAGNTITAAVKVLSITAGLLANDIDASGKNFNAAKVGGKAVNDSGVTVNDLWTAYKTKDYVDTLVGGLDTNDIAEGTNLYFTDERAQDAIGSILTDSSSVDFTYDDNGNTITAAVKVDASTIKIDGTNNYIYVDTVDGGTF